MDACAAVYAFQGTARVWRCAVAICSAFVVCTQVTIVIVDSIGVGQRVGGLFFPEQTLKDKAVLMDFGIQEGEVDFASSQAHAGGIATWGNLVTILVCVIPFLAGYAVGG